MISKVYMIFQKDYEDLVKDIQALIPHTEDGKEIFDRILMRFNGDMSTPEKVGKERKRIGRKKYESNRKLHEKQKDKNNNEPSFLHFCK